MKKLGFTLLEILVVIGIIAILVGLGATSYSTAQKKARDAKRKGDLKAIQNAFEQYHAICGNVYPAPVSGKTASSVVCSSPSSTVMSSTPTDPLSGSLYIMTQPDGTTATFSICATLEAESPASYCLTNQQ